MLFSLVCQSEQLWLRGMSLQIFRHKPILDKLYKKQKSQGSTKVFRIHPLATINVGTKFCANLFCRCWDISQDEWKLWPAGGATRKVRGSPKSLEFSLWWTKCDASPSNRCWDIWLPDQQINIAIHKAMPLAWLKSCGNWVCECVSVVVPILSQFTQYTKHA